MRDLNSESDLNALKVPELKEELEARGIMDKKLKLKKDLIDALHDFLVQQEGQGGGAAAPEAADEPAEDEKTTSKTPRSKRGQKQAAEEDDDGTAAAEAAAAAAAAEKEAAEAKRLKEEAAALKKEEEEKQRKKEEEAAALKKKKEEEEKKAKEKEEKEKAAHVAEERRKAEAQRKEAEREKKRKEEEEEERKRQQQKKDEEAAKAKREAEKEKEKSRAIDEDDDESERKRKTEEEALRRMLLQGQKKPSTADSNLKRSASNEVDANGDRKRRRGWGNTSTSAKTSGAQPINTDMLKEIITATATTEEHDVEDMHGDEEVIEDEDPSTASASLHIINFTRPLQLAEVKDLLGGYGTLIEGDDGFWMDKQKRLCLCTFETVEMAMAAKRGIHGLRFPVGNPKTLEVVYTTLEKMLSLRDEHSAEPRRSVQGRDAASEHSRSHREHKEAERVEEPQPSEQNETEGMLELEKLFNKTKSSPQIFWKPLTDEEVEEKKKRMGRPSTKE